MAVDDPGPLVQLPNRIPLGVIEASQPPPPPLPPPTVNGDQPPDDDGQPDVPIVFESLRAFLARKLPPAESLVGVTRDGTNLLPRYGWVMPWGREGSGKTSLLVDLIFHAAAGINWLQYEIERPLRIVAVINEGIPGGLQDKLKQKIERWDGDRGRVLDNVSVYASPWGEFTFRNSAMFDHARSYVRDFEADYVALDPLHTLGTSGAGSPQETEEFKRLLMTFGVWDDVGVITAHHSNKAGMISGDWGRHPDTVIRVEKDGKNPASKFTVEKARPADPNELGVPQLLSWVIDTLSYRSVAIETTPAVEDSEVLSTVLDVLREADGPIGMEDVKTAAKGTAKRVRDVVVRAIDQGMIRNLSAGSRHYSLVIGPNSPTVADGQLSIDEENGLNKPNLTVGGASTVADGERRDLTGEIDRRPSAPSLEGPTVTTVDRTVSPDDAEAARRLDSPRGDTTPSTNENPLLS